jgi:hypothetical protein
MLISIFGFGSAVHEGFQILPFDDWRFYRLEMFIQMLIVALFIIRMRIRYIEKQDKKLKMAT